MRAAVRALPPRQRDALFLRFYLDFDYVAIAETLGIEVGTVSGDLACSTHESGLRARGGTAMSFDDDVLDRLAPALPWEPDWADVLGRADEREWHRWPRPRGKRRLIVALAALVAVLVPIVAVGAANDWWFLRVGGPFAPAGTPVVVQQSTWDGYAWQLVAYVSTRGDLCFGVVPAGSEPVTSSGAIACSPFVGITRADQTTEGEPLALTYLSGGFGTGDRHHDYIAGPVVDGASQVEIRLVAGQVLRLPTFPAPASVGNVRFYTGLLPADVSIPRAPGPFSQVVASIAGLDGDGNVVACLVLSAAVDGVSPLSACR